MAPYTKLDGRNALLTEVMNFLPAIQMDSRVVDFNFARGERQVFFKYLMVQEEFFRTHTSFSDGANIPDRFFAFANMAVGSNGVTASYIDPANVAFRTTNPLDLARATSPSYTIIDQKIKIFPNTETLDTWYYQLPKNLGLITVPDNEESSMPPELLRLCALAGARLHMQLLLGIKGQVELSSGQQKIAKNSIKIMGKLYDQYMMQEDRLA